MVRAKLREHIFKMLFQREFHESSEMPEHLKLYFTQLGELEDQDKTYMETKFQAVEEKIPEIDALLNQTATKWKTDRMPKVDLSILRLAVYEIKWDEDVPVRVAINEAVVLAKKFGGDDSSSFINGVLGKLVKED